MSPIEYVELRDAPVPLGRCPRAECDEPFYPFMRGMVQRNPRPWWLFGRRRGYCALICRECKCIVGWEAPPEASGRETRDDH